MACYEVDLFGHENQKNRVSDWDMHEYDEIQDFQCTTDFASAKKGQSAIIW